MKPIPILLILFLYSTLSFAFDHEYKTYATVLGTYVHGGLVDYASLQKDRNGIDEFVRDITSVNEAEYKSWNRNQQLAYWINTYNGWFLQIVINHYPIKRGTIVGLIFPANSVQQIPGVWKGIKMQAGGQEVSLDIIEHKILRPQFQEPRIHFAIVCASKGCPVLRSVPYNALRLEEQLDRAARDFINNALKVRLEKATGKFFVSQIFKWFSEDFSRFADESWKKQYPEKQAGPLAFIAKYLPSADGQLIKRKKISVEYLDYDWSLNEKPAK